MDFEFTDEQQQLRDAVRRWVDKGFAFERRHALAKAGGHTREVLGELAELGLAGLVVPEAHGGLGQGPVEAMVVMEELGRGLVNAPFAAGALVAPSLLAHGGDALHVFDSDDCLHDPAAPMFPAATRLLRPGLLWLASMLALPLAGAGCTTYVLPHHESACALPVVAKLSNSTARIRKTCKKRFADILFLLVVKYE